ncbi:MAG: membrane dipeptidase [Bdellovibrionales bacterium]|nr:membrane dipeptidase [Bdellovibrionales bacterium]
MRRITTWILLFVFASPHFARAQMDLHAHLDLKPGVGLLLRGDFDSPARSSKWDDRVRTKASSQSLTAFESPPLIVISFYGHPFFSNPLSFDWKTNVRDANETEYRHLIEFVRTHPLFEIAKTPREAENLLSDKRIPIVLSIEGAYGTLENEDDIRKWVDERGVAIVTPFHLSEDHFGGVSMMYKFWGFAAAPIEFFKSMLITGFSCLSDFCKSTVGMTGDGRVLIDSLMRHKVWIDLAHANDIEIGELLPEFKKRKLPILVTHTSPREIYPAERGLPTEVMNAIIDNDGMIGLIPTEDMMKRSWTRSPCFSGLVEFKQSVHEMIKVLGEERVVLGSDINAPLDGLSPICDVKPGQMLSPLEEKGFYTYSQWPTLGQYVSPDTSWSEKSLRHFISLWKRVAQTRESF